MCLYICLPTPKKVCRCGKPAFWLWYCWDCTDTIMRKLQEEEEE